MESLERRREPRSIDFGRGLKLMTVWHLVGAASCAVGVMLASRGGDSQLPATIKFFLLGFFILAFVAHAASAAGIASTATWARTSSLVVNYLIVVVAGAATLHQLNAFRAIGDLGEGLYKAFVPFLVISVGLVWVLLAGQMLANKPHAPGPNLLRKAGWSLAAIASVWFVMKADPRGLLSVFFERIVQPVTLGSLLLALGGAAGCSFMWKRRAAKHFQTSTSTENTLTGLAFLSPNLLGFLFFFAGPLVFSLIVSFFDWKTTNTGRSFVGLDNYVRALSLDFSSTEQANAGTEAIKNGYQVLMHADWFGQHWVIGARDIEFWLSLRNIVIFLVLAVPAAVLPALVLSSILSSRLAGMKIFRAIYFIPSVAGVIGVSIIWGQLFDKSIGWINYLLDLVGLSEAGSGQGWLTERSTALLAIVVVFAWMNFGFNTVLYLAGHQSIPKELYEAAEIDGANVVQVFKRITVPQLRNTTFYVLITTSILALQLFDVVWILSKPEPGGPNNATTTPVLSLYEEAFRNNAQGYASALAWVLFLIIFGFTFFQFRQQRDEATSGGVS
jgi:ABC-type sugar transport system permease subunit